MNYLTIEETKKTALDCLIFIDKFCRENGIKYSIAYGTLLGAIRHGGFIPWDDDIDIIMLRTEYDRFLDCFTEKNENNRYKLLSFEKGTYYFPFSKIVDTTTKVQNDFIPHEDLGLGIDVFPYDNVGNTKPEVDKIKKKARFIARFNQFAVMKRDYRFYGFSALLKYPLFWYSKIRGLKHWHKKIEKITLKKAADKPTRFVDYVADLESLPTESTFFDELTDISFEGHSFQGPVRYKDCLTYWYGDYMKLPPKEQQVPHIQQAWRIK